MNTSCKAELINTHFLTSFLLCCGILSYKVKRHEKKQKQKQNQKNSKTFYDNHTGEPVTQRKVIIRMIRKYSQP